MVQISYLPPILKKEEEEKPKEYIVPTTLIEQGKAEYEVTKARNLMNTSASVEQSTMLKPPKNQREAMYNVGTDLQDNDIAKDEAWWKKALGWLEPFKYLDVPIELAAEAVFDPIAKATGRDLSWIRGSAERKPFEAWSAMFGGDVSAEKTGMGELMARMDMAAEAFEKRPFVTQLGLMGVQMAASFGAAGYAKAAAAGVKWGGTLGGKAARTGAMILDPWEIGFHGLKYGFKGAKSLLKTPNAEDGTSLIITNMSNPAIAAIMGAKTSSAVSNFDLLRDRVRKSEGIGGSGNPLEWMINSPAGRFRAQSVNHWADQFGWSDTTYRPRFSIRGDGLKGSVIKENDAVGPAVNRSGDADAIPLVLERDNKFQIFMNEKWRAAQDAPSGSWERIQNLQQLAAFQLTLSLGARPGHTFKATFKELIADSNSFLNTNRLRHYDDKQRSAMMFPLDMGESHTAIRALSHEMREFGKLNNLGANLEDWVPTKANPDPELFSFKVNPDGTFSFGEKGKKATDSLNKMLQGLRGEGWTDLPDGAEQIRQHAATVLVLQGIPFEHVKQLLNHSEVGTTRIYVREMPYIGFKSDDLIQGGTGRFDSTTYKQVSLAARIKNAVKEVAEERGKKVDESGELIEKSEYYTSLGDRISSFSALVKQIKDAPRAKGAEIAKADYEDIVAEMTEIVLYNPAMKKMVDEYIPDWARSLADADDVIGAGAEAIRVAEEMATLTGVFNMVNEIERGISFADNVKQATNHNYSPRDGRTRREFYRDRGLKKPNTKFNAPGLLNRAGYFIEDGEYQWAGNIIVGEEDSIQSKAIRLFWTQERDKLARQSNLHWNDEGLDPMLTKADDEYAYREKLWDNWVSDNFTNAKNGDEIREMNVIRAEDFEKGRKTLEVSDVLRHGLEVKQWELFHEWNQLRGLADGDATNAVAGDLDSIFSMLMGLTGEGGIRGAKKEPGWVFARINELKKIHRVRPELNLSWQNTTTGKLISGGATADINTRLRMPSDEMTKAWLETDDVSKAFKIHKITPGSSEEELIKGLHRLARTGSHGIFGGDFALFFKNHPNEANDWVEEFGKKLARTFFDNESWWAKIDANIEHDYTEFLERINAYRQQRPQIKGSEGIIRNKVTALLGIGGVARIQDVAENITSLTNVFGKNFNEWYNSESVVATVIRRSPLPLVYSAFTGGTAGLARPITKAISARARQYLKSEVVGRNAGVQFEAVSQDLGLNRITLSVEQENLGIVGHEFFSKLKVKDIKKIQAWEDKVGNIKYRRFATEKRKKAGTLSRLKDTMREKDSTSWLEPSLTQDYLRQVDVVLERIHPEDWHQYFDGMYLTKPGTGIKGVPAEYIKDEFGDFIWTKQGEDLLYLKDMMHQMDRIAGERGVKVVETIRSAGGRYLSNYFPRMYKMENKTRLQERSGRNYLLNSQSGFFQKRDETLEDIIDVIGFGRDGLQKYDLEDVSKRAGAYIESMYKEIADLETVNWIKSSPDYIALEKVRNKLDGKHRAARDLESLINERITRETTEKMLEGGMPGELTELGYSPSVDKLRKVIAAFSDDPEGAKYMELLADTSTKSTEALAQLQSKILSFARRQRKEASKNVSDLDKYRLGDEKGLDQIITATRVLDPRDQQAIKQHLVVSHNFLGNFLKWPAFVMQRPTEALRYFKSGIDMGAPMIHGFNALVRAPLGRQGLDATSTRVWFKGVKNMFKFAYDPDLYDKYIVDNLQLMNEAGEYVRLGTPEPLQIIDTSATMMKVRAWATDHLPKHKHAKFLSRFEKGFTGYLDVMRTELWKGMKGSVDSDLNKAAKKLDSMAFEKMRRQKYHELGAIINKMTGAFDPEMAQQTPFQRLIENSLLFFAPMYRRATFGILADTFRGGKRSEEALRQMSGIIVAGGMMGMLAEMTGINDRAFLFDQEGELGEKGELDITARFGKFNIGGMQTGIGTAWWTIFRTASDVAMHMYHGEEEVDLDKDHWANHWAMTMLGRRGRSQLAPGTSLALDIFTGSTFIGDPLRDADENNYAAMGKHITRSTVPFWLDGIFAGGVSGALVASPAEFFGLSSYELSSYDKLTKARREAIANWDDSNFGKEKSVMHWRKTQEISGETANYINMPLLLKRHLDEQNPQVKALKHDHDMTYGTSTYGDARTMFEYRSFKSEIDRNALSTLASLSKRIESGTADYNQLQDAISNVKYAKRVSNMAQMEKYPELAARFADLRLSKANSEVIFMGDIYYDAWQEVRNDPSHKDEDNTFNYKRMQEAESLFWADPSALQYKDYVVERSRQWNEHLPVVREFEEAKDYLRDQKYWDIEDLIWAPGSQQHSDADEYLKLPVKYRDYKRASDPYYQEIQRAVERKREQIVSQDQELDRILVTYYGNNPRHPLNAGLKEQLMLENVTKPSRTPDPNSFKVSETGRIYIEPIRLQ